MSPRGVFYLEIDCGENPRAALDYLNHYRSPHLLGIDADYAMSRAYQAHGWPTFVVVDQGGIVRFHGFPADLALSELRQHVSDLVRKSPEATLRRSTIEHGIALPVDCAAIRRARRDRSPRLAFDKSGNVMVVFYSNREGYSAVYQRRFDPLGQPQDERLSLPGIESYAPDCVFDDTGTLWTVWCARQGEFYNLWVQARPAQGDPVTQQLAFSRDDAMSPRIAAGSDGTVAVAYYDWHKLNGVSRDRNVFARIYDPRQQAWGDPLEISPHEPEVEDHTDPDVVVDSAGKAWIAWSYDYHPQLFKNPVEAEQPTIFAARMANRQVSAALLVGATGDHRSAIDLFPTVALDNQGVLWCAWDSSEPDRCIRLARLNAASNSFQLVSTFAKRGGICSTPELTAADGNRLLLAWSQRADGFWEGKVALLHEGKPEAECVLMEDADMLFLQAQQNHHGQIWVTGEKSDAKGSEVVVRNITRKLAAASSPTR